MPNSASVSAPPEASPYARHIPALDGIRGLAVLGVAASHLFLGAPTNALTIYIGKLLALGAGGVDLFFALSGFLITGILYDSLVEPHFFRKFYARRALRIFPLYYGVLAAFALAALVFGLNFHGELWSFALYLQNTWLIATPIYAYQGPTMLYLQHFWSLAIEEQFYLVWPLLVFLIRRRGRLLWLCAAFFVLCPLLRLGLLWHGVPYLAINGNTLCNADLLLAGAALALLLRGPAHDRILQLGPWLLILGIAIFSASSLLAAHPNLTGHPALLLGTATAISYSACAAASVGLIALSLRAGFTRKFFSTASLRFLGKYSYGIYVFHVILFNYLRTPLRAAIAAHLTQSKAAGVLLTGLFSFALTLILAFLSYQVYERPFLRLKRFFDYRPQPARVPPTS